MRVEHSILIDAPPEMVWAVTTDVERWPEWTPTVTSVERLDAGPFGLGSRTRIKQPLQPESEWTVSEYEEGRSFAWTTNRAGLRMTGRHLVKPLATGTENVLEVEAEGLLALLLWPILRPAMRRALSDENRGLKSRCEQAVAAG